MSEGPPYKSGPVLRQEGMGGGSSSSVEIPQDVREQVPTTGLSAQLQEARARVTDLENREKQALEKKAAIRELENRLRSGAGVKSDNAGTEQQILRLEQEIRALEGSTEKSGGASDPTAAERRAELATAVAQLENYGMVGAGDVPAPTVPNTVANENTTARNARSESVKAAARQDAANYAVRSSRMDFGENPLHPEYKGKRFNIMNETLEGRARNAEVLAKAAGVDAEREALRQAELRLIEKEGEHYEKGILRRGISNHFGKSSDERVILEHQMNERALEYEQALNKSVKIRLDEKRVMLENQLADTATYKPGSEERKSLEKLLKRHTEGTPERLELEKRYRRTVASRDVVERGEKRREVAKKEALATRSYNPAEIVAIGTLRYLEERNAALEKKLGKTGARVARALAFSLGGSGIAALFGPVAATAVVGAAGYSVARTLASTAVGGAVAGVAGKLYEKTRGKKAAESLVTQFEGEGGTSADIARKRNAYVAGNAEAIARKRKRLEVVSAIAAGGGLSYGASMALANPEFAHFIEHGVDAAKVDLEAAKNAMGRALHEINPIGTAYGGEHGVSHVSHMVNGLGDHYHQSPAVMAKLEVGAENGLGYEAMMHHLQEEATKQGLTATDFPEGSDMHALLAANGAEQSNRVLQELAIKNHFLDPKTLKSIEVPKTAHMSFVDSGDGKGNILYSRHEFAPVPRSGPGQLSGEPRAGELDPTQHITTGQLTGEPRPGDHDPVGHYAVHRELSGEPRPNSPDPAGRFPNDAVAPHPHGNPYASGEAVSGSMHQPEMPAGEATGGPELHTIFPQNPTVPVLNGQGYEATITEWARQAKAMGLTSANFPPGSPAARLLEAVGTQHQSTVADVIAREHNFVYENGTSPLMQQGGNIHVGTSGNFEVFDPKMSVHTPFVENAPTGMRATPPTPSPRAEMPAPEMGRVSSPGITADRLNEYVATHPGASGPFIVKPDGSIGEAGSIHSNAAPLTEKAPAVAGVEPQNLPHSPTGQPSAEGFLRGVNGLMVDPKHASLYLTPDDKFVAYGGSYLDRTKAAMKYVYDHPGSTVWLQGEGGIGPNGDPYIVSMHTEVTNGQTLFFPPQAVTQPEQINKVILPEDLVRVVQ